MRMKCYDILSTKIMQGLYESDFLNDLPAILSITTDLIATYMDEDLSGKCPCKLIKAECCQQNKCSSCSSVKKCKYIYRWFWIYEDIQKSIFYKPQELDKRLRLYGNKISARELRKYENEIDNRGNLFCAKIELICGLIISCATRETWDIDKCTCKLECYEKVLPYLFFFNLDTLELAVDGILKKKIKNYGIKRAVKKCFKLMIVLRKSTKDFDWMKVYLNLKDMSNLAVALISSSESKLDTTEQKRLVLQEICLKNFGDMRLWENYSKLFKIEGLKLLGIKKYLQFRRITRMSGTFR